MGRYKTVKKWAKSSGVPKKYIKGAGMAYRALKIAMYVKKLINVEKKFADVYLAGGTAITNTGTIYNLSSIAEGDDYNQRNGLSVKATSLYLKMLFTGNTAATVTCTRFMVFIDTQYRTSDPSPSDVLEQLYVNSPLNHINGGRFSVLYDKTISLATAGQIGININKYLKLNHHIKYASTTSADSSLKEGQVLLLVIADQATNQPNFSLYSRLRYIDN